MDDYGEHQEAKRELIELQGLQDAQAKELERSGLKPGEIGYFAIQKITSKLIE